MISLIYTTILLTVLYYVPLTNCQAEAKFFRNDYSYIEDRKAFYKIHTIHRSWEEATEMCSKEWATLFYPEDEDEVDSIIAFWNNTQPFSWVFIGISTPNAQQVFETVDGYPASSVYDKWGPGEPNNANGMEGCVILRRDGTLNDDNCENKYPFICKKNLNSLEWNNLCNIPDLGYEYVENLGRCYKFHLTPMNWTDAYTICNTEQSYLAIINSRVEAAYLKQLTENTKKDHVQGDYLRGAVHLGFKLKKGKWQTLASNMPLEHSGYTVWGGGQPDGAGLETCGSMFYNAELNDVGCDRNLFFICEREIPLLEGSIIPRFGTTPNKSTA